jgi:hypothetical protein
VFNPLDYPLFLEHPERPPRGAHRQSVPFAMALVQMLRPRRVVALGLGDGDVYLATCQAVAALGLDAACRGIDEAPSVELRAHHDARYGAFSRLITASPATAASRLGDSGDSGDSGDPGDPGDVGDAPLDLVIVDPSGGIDGAAAFAGWRARTSARAVVAVYDNDGGGRGEPLWRELAADRPSFQLDHAGGLGIVAIGSDVPDPVRELAALGPADAAALRSCYARVGAAAADVVARELHARVERADHTEAVLSEVLDSVSFRVGKTATAPLRWAFDRAAEAIAWRPHRRSERPVRPRGADGNAAPAPPERLQDFVPGARPARVCLFSHFDRDGIVDDYVVRYLEALRGCALDIVFVSTAPTLRPEALARVAPLCAAVLLRENVGFDFGSWRAALDSYPWILDGELLVVANDSVYGPVRALRPLFDRMSARACDFWGMTESRQLSQHLQSYFLAFGKECLQSEAFRAFFADVAFFDDKKQVIDAYELTLTGRLAAAGLRWAAVAPHIELDGRLLNPVHHLWRSTLDGGVPFVKVELLRDNPLKANLHGWEAFLRDRLGYETEPILRHLRRVKPDAVALRVR